MILSNMLGSNESYPRRRVVITGMDMITPFGVGTSINFLALLGKQSAITELVDPRNPNIHSQSLVPDFNLNEYVLRSIFDPKRIDKADQMMVIAAKGALRQAGLIDDDYNLTDPAASQYGVAAGKGANISLINITQKFYGDKKQKVTPSDLKRMQTDGSAHGPSKIPNGGFEGPKFTISAACASGLAALINAFIYIQSGRVNGMIVVGGDALCHPITFNAFANSKALSTNEDFKIASRPFHPERDGFVMGEAGVALVVEDEETALKRGAHPLAELVEVGDVSSKEDVKPEKEFAERAMLQSMTRNPTLLKNLKSDEKVRLGFHGTSTDYGDLEEVSAAISLLRNLGILAQAIGGSDKGNWGHTVAAAGLLSTVKVIMEMNTGLIVPTLNLDRLDPALSGLYIPSEVIQAIIGIAIVNSFGFNGHYKSVALRRYKPYQ